MFKERSSVYFRDALGHKTTDMAAWLYNIFDNININFTNVMNSALHHAIGHRNIEVARWIITLPKFILPSKESPGDIKACLRIALREGCYEIAQLVMQIIDGSSSGSVCVIDADHFTDACWGGDINNIILIESSIQPAQPMQSIYNYGFMTAIWNYKLPVLVWMHETGKIDIRHNNDAGFRELFNNRVTSVTHQLYDKTSVDNKLLEMARWFTSVCKSYHIVESDGVMTGFNIDPPSRPDLVLDEDYISQEQGNFDIVNYNNVKDNNTCTIS
jgi:hypothetical protein